MPEASIVHFLYDLGMPVVEHVTACPLDCPDTCSLAVTVTDGTITKVDAAPGNPVTAGFICQKVKHHAQRVYAPERVLTPLVRVGPKGKGEFREASWEEATALIGQRLRSARDEAGAESIVPFMYGSSAPVTQQVLGSRLWRRVGASVIDHTICAATHAVAYASIFGDMLSGDPRDVAHSEVVVVWGANPTVSNVHFPPLVADAQRASGTKLVVIDPRRTGMAKRADLHLAIAPGTDVVLAMAIASELERRGRIDCEFLAEHAEGVDEFLAAARAFTVADAASVCAVDRTQIEDFIELLTGSRRVFYRVGWGLERNRNGGSACASVFALPVLAGHFGVRGAGVMSSLSDAAPIRTPFTDADRVRHPHRPRHFNMNNFGAVLCDPTLEPPIRVLIVQGSNLAATNPDQVRVLAGLERDDLFTVVHDQVLTDTARYADVVLPATTHFESNDLTTSYGSYTLQAMSPVIAPIGLSKTDNEVSALFAIELGEPAADFDPAGDAVIAASLTKPMNEAILELRGAGTTVQFVDTFPTYAGRRARLTGYGEIGVPRFVDHDVAERTRFPLVLLTPSSPKTINSMFAEFQALDPAIRMCPVDAVARGLGDGERVEVFNDRATVLTTVRIDDDLQPLVVVMPKGSWLRDFEGGLTANALAPDTFSDLADGACFNDALVEVRARR